jgi:hypothetical protein
MQYFFSLSSQFPNIREVHRCEVGISISKFLVLVSQLVPVVGRRGLRELDDKWELQVNIYMMKDCKDLPVFLFWTFCCAVGANLFISLDNLCFTIIMNK